MELAHRILPHRSDQRSDSIILYVYNFSAFAFVRLPASRFSCSVSIIGTVVSTHKNRLTFASLARRRAARPRGPHFSCSGFSVALRSQSQIQLLYCVQ